MKKPLLPFSYFIALRYLRPKRTFLSVITLISIIGVVLGISVLIIVISVMTGFERELERKVIGFEAHITISPEPNTFLSNWREAMKVAEKVPGVTGVTPTTLEPVIIEFKQSRMDGPGPRPRPVTGKRQSDRPQTRHDRREI